MIYLAAGFGLIATVFGILSHIREFSVTGFTTCFASIGAFFGLLAFIFDIVLFEIALKRINAVGANAMLGNAVWLCLAGTLCLMFSGCFFGIGRCLIRNRKGDVDPNVNVAGKTMPILPDHFGARTTLPQDESSVTPPGGYGQGAMYKSNASTGGGGGLPIFQDRDGEIIPLTHMNDRMSMEEEEDYNNEKYRRNGSYSNHTPQYPGGYTVPQSSSLVSGVGLGYGRRGENGNGIAFSPSGDSAFAPIAPGAAGLGAGNTGGLNFAQQHQQQRLGSTVEPFVGMNHSPTTSEAQNYANYGDYAPPSSPPPQQYQQQQQRNQSVSQQGSYRGGPSPPRNNESFSSQPGYNSNPQGVEQTGAYYTLPPPTSHFSQPSLNSQPSYGQQSSYSNQDNNTAASTPTSNYATAIASRYATPPQSQLQSQQYPPPSQSPPPSQQQHYPVPSTSPPPPSSANPAPSYYSQSNRQPSQYSPTQAGARRYGSTVSTTTDSAAPTANTLYGTAMNSEPLSYQPQPQQQHLRGGSQQRDSFTSLGGEQGSVAGGGIGGGGNYNHGRNGSNSSYNNNTNNNGNGRNGSNGGYQSPQQQQQGDEAVQRRY